MPELIVRNPTPAEVEKAADIAYVVFGQDQDKWQSSFHTIAEMFGERFILVCEVDGELVSTLICTPGPVYVGDAEVSHSAVGAVCTLSQHRRHGCAQALLTQCVKLLREEGISTSSLWPASYEYYRKFGWEVGCEVRTYTADASALTTIGDPSKARYASLDDLPEIKKIYDSCARDYNCSTLRSDDWWDRIVHIKESLASVVETGRRVIVSIADDGQLSGYAIYAVRTEEERKLFFISEIMCPDNEHRRNILAMLASIEPDARIRFSTPVDDLFFHGIPNPRLINAMVRPSFEFRIADPLKAMASLKPMEHISCSFTLSIDDPVFAHGFEFDVRAKDGKVEIDKPLSNNKLRMDVQTLAKLYTGYLDPMYAWQLGKIKTDGDAMRALVDASGVFSPLTPFRSWVEPG
ncbi:GNAT family N-acetyltransferase [bacterium]|nr:GNAT family N-acetyltransferase [bacterium]